MKTQNGQISPILSILPGLSHILFSKGSDHNFTMFFFQPRSFSMGEGVPAILR